MLEIIGTLQWAMPVVASVGIAVTVWLTMRGWRKEDQRREVERAKADARRDALLEDLVKRSDSLGGRVEEVREGLEQRIDGVRTDLTERIEGVRTDLTERIEGVRTELTERIDGVRTDLTGRIDGVRADLTERIQAHEDKCEARWLQQAKEFGEMRGALAAQQRTIEAVTRAHAAGPPQNAGQG